MVLLGFLWVQQWWIWAAAPAAALSLIALGGLILTLAALAWPGGITPRTVAWVLGSDIVLLTGAIYLTGGPDQVSGPILYAAIIGLAGLLLNPQAAIAAGVGCAGAYLSVCGAVVAGFLPNPLHYGRPRFDQGVGVSTTALFLLMIAALIAFVADRARRTFLLALAEREAAVRDLALRLREPLERILAAAGAALRSGGGPEQIRALAPQMGQALAAVDSLLGMSLVEETRRVAGERRVALQELLFAAAADLGMGERLQLGRGSPARMRVRCDPGRLSHVLRWLLRTAARHAGSHPIRAEMRREGQDAVLVLSWPATAPLPAAVVLAAGRIAAMVAGSFTVSSEGRRTSMALRLPRAGQRGQPPYAAPVPGLERVTVPVVSSVHGAKTVALLLGLCGAVAARLSAMPELPLVPVAVAILLSAALSWWIARLGAATPAGLWGLSLAVDVLAATGAIHLGGGVEQVAGPQLYVLLVGIAGLLVSPRAAWLVAAGSSLSYASVAAAELQGWIETVGSVRRPPDRQIATAVMVGVCLCIVAAVVHRAARVLRENHARIDAARREAIGSLVHDVKNPLGVIHAYVEMAGESPPPDPGRALAGIMRAARTALELVLNVLATERIEELGHTLNLQRVDPVALVRSLAHDYQPLARLRGIVLAVDPAPAGLAVRADPQLLERAVANLLSNALRYCRSGDEVRLGIAARGAEVRITVADTGPGIPAEHLRTLFRAYRRGHSDREGSGLGLHIVRRVAAVHGGRVEVDSRPGRGTRFELVLPGREAPLGNASGKGHGGGPAAGRTVSHE